MSKEPFFSERGPAERVYLNLLAPSNPRMESARQFTEELWNEFEPLADPEYLTEVRTRFDERFWEMYLTVSLTRAGYEVTCPKPGPDVGILYEGRRIWFEAVCASRGADGSPDQVPESKMDGTVQDVPNQLIILRYLNSISEKYERKYSSWMAAGRISKKDAFVIALNPRPLGFDYADTVPPRILQAAFPLGNAYVTLDRSTLAAVATGYEFRSTLPKASGALVDTGVFLHEGYEGLSGLLVSRVDVANRPDQIGADFQLLPNPTATTPLPEGFRLPGTYFAVTPTDSGYSVTPQGQ